MHCETQLYHGMSTMPLVDLWNFGIHLIEIPGLLMRHKELPERTFFSECFDMVDYDCNCQFKS
jgi:hypothetical protein